MHHLRGNAIPAVPLSDSDENLCCCGIPIHSVKQNFNIVGIDMSA